MAQAPVPEPRCLEDVIRYLQQVIPFKANIFLHVPLEKMLNWRQPAEEVLHEVITVASPPGCSASRRKSESLTACNSVVQVNG